MEVYDISNDHTVFSEVQSVDIRPWSNTVARGWWGEKLNPSWFGVPTWPGSCQVPPRMVLPLLPKYHQRSNTPHAAWSSMSCAISWTWIPRTWPKPSGMINNWLYHWIPCCIFFSFFYFFRRIWTVGTLITIGPKHFFVSLWNSGNWWAASR